MWRQVLSWRAARSRSASSDVSLFLGSTVVTGITTPANAASRDRCQAANTSEQASMATNGTAASTTVSPTTTATAASANITLRVMIATAAPLITCNVAIQLLPATGARTMARPVRRALLVTWSTLGGGLASRYAVTCRLCGEA